MTHDPPRYRIVAVGDFLKVPEGRRAACLADFGRALATFGQTVRLVESVAESHGEPIPPGSFSMPYFEWVDDGKRDVEIRLGE